MTCFPGASAGKRCNQTGEKEMDVNTVRPTEGKTVSPCQPALLKPLFFTRGQTLQFLVKRAVDILFSAIFLILLLPAMAVIAAAVRLTSKGPAVFRQKRIGRYGKTMVVYKFRTMLIDAPNVATADLDDPDQYITSIGKFLRKTSLDELPQLLNILKGDMSFIGPRPLIPEEQEIHDRRLHEGIYYLRPGLTGLAQVNGRDLVSAERKVAYDTEYLRKFSLKLDFVIFLRTISIVVTHDGVVDGRVPAEEECAEPEAAAKAEPEAPVSRKVSQMSIR